MKTLIDEFAKRMLTKSRNSWCTQTSWQDRFDPVFISVVLLASMLLASGCGNAESSKERESQPTDEPPVVVKAGGKASFHVNGEAQEFDYQDRSNSLYYKQASVVHFQPEPGATEWLAINLMQVDLKILQYPIDLPLPRDLKNPTSLTGTMATIGIGFIDSDGNEWAGPGTVRLESFDEDGILTGSFDDVTIPHTDKTLAPITLSNGRFEAKL